METLEELKAIIAGKPDDAQSVMMVFNPIYTKLENDFWYAACKGQDWLQVTDKQIGNMRSLSDIERIIELMEIVEDTAALGFLTPSFDSGVSHKQLCKKYEALK